jgi:hypothetical protein
MAIRPLHDRILVKRVKEEETTKGGIIIPDTAKEKPIEAKVVAVGTGRILGRPPDPPRRRHPRNHRIGDSETWLRKRSFTIQLLAIAF